VCILVMLENVGMSLHACVNLIYCSHVTCLLTYCLAASASTASVSKATASASASNPGGSRDTLAPRHFGIKLQCQSVRTVRHQFVRDTSAPLYSCRPTLMHFVLYVAR